MWLVNEVYTFVGDKVVSYSTTIIDMDLDGSQLSFYCERFFYSFMSLFIDVVSMVTVKKILCV